MGHLSEQVSRRGSPLYVLLPAEAGRLAWSGRQVLRRLTDRHPVVTGAVLVVMASTVVLALASVAGASDNAGVHAFWAEQAAARDSVAAAPLRGSVVPLPGPRVTARVLVVRRLGSKVVRSRPLRGPVLAFVPPPHATPAVSIFEDRTLRRGDAVMMQDGMRVFAGARAWPLTPRDFLALRVARGIDLHLRRTLVAIDNLPRA